MACGRGGCARERPDFRVATALPVRGPKWANSGHPWVARRSLEERQAQRRAVVPPPSARRVPPCSLAKARAAPFGPPLPERGFSFLSARARATRAAPSAQDVGAGLVACGVRFRGGSFAPAGLRGALRAARAMCPCRGSECARGPVVPGTGRAMSPWSRAAVAQSARGGPSARARVVPGTLEGPSVSGLSGRSMSARHSSRTSSVTSPRVTTSL